MILHIWKTISSMEIDLDNASNTNSLNQLNNFTPEKKITPYSKIELNNLELHGKLSESIWMEIWEPKPCFLI